MFETSERRTVEFFSFEENGTSHSSSYFFLEMLAITEITSSPANFFLEIKLGHSYGKLE